MSIMARLMSEIPIRRKSLERNPVYLVAKRYYGEIEEAQKAGYAWSQICDAVKAECVESGEWNEGWGSYKIAEMFNILKKQRREE